MNIFKITPYLRRINLQKKIKKINKIEVGGIEYENSY